MRILHKPKSCVNLFCIIQELGKSWEVLCAYEKQICVSAATETLGLTLFLISISLSWCNGE